MEARADTMIRAAIVAIAVALTVPVAGAADVASPAPAKVAGSAGAPKAPAPVALADAFRNGQVVLSVWVVPGTGDGRALKVGIKNTTKAKLRVAIPAGPTALDVGSPIGTLNVRAASRRVLAIGPGATAGPVNLAQTGAQRAIDGTFTLWVADGKPEFRGEVTTGNVGP